MKIMFLDESGDHSLQKDKIDKSYPMFVLAGCIFDLPYYKSKAEPQMNDLKMKHFGKTDIILRSYDIRKQKNDFSCLVNKTKREAFLKELNLVIQSLNFTIIAGAINKLRLIDTYTQPISPYTLCFQFILERAIMYLGRTTELLIMRAESRETHNDKDLAVVYENFRLKGNNIINAEEVQRKFIDLSFNHKMQNISGHQIADLVAYPIGKWVLDSSKENKPFDIIKTKLHQKNGHFQNFGLKIFP